MIGTDYIFGRRREDSYVLPDINNLFHYYDLESNVQDHFALSSGSPIDITYASGLYGTGAVFNGTTSKIIMPANLLHNSTQLSFSFLVKANNTNAEYRVFSLNNNQTPQGPFVSVRLNAGGVANRIGLLIYDGVDANLLFTDNYNVTQGVHIGATAISGSNYKFFVNGDLVGTDSNFGNFAQVASLGNHFGTNRIATGQFLPGMMRGVGIWKVANTEVEMQGIAQKQLSGRQII